MRQIDRASSEVSWPDPPHHRMLAAALVVMLSFAACSGATASPQPTVGPISTPSTQPTTASTSSPTAETKASPTVRPTVSATDSPSPSPAVALEPCPTAPAIGTICLGTDPATLAGSAGRGKTLELSLAVTNSTSTASAPMTLVVFQFDPGPWPFGAASCSDCSHLAKSPFLSFEWAALAPGETRVLTASIALTGSPGAYIWFANLYAQSLADVQAAAKSAGITDGMAGWKAALTITR